MLPWRKQQLQDYRKTIKVEMRVEKTAKDTQYESCYILFTVTVNATVKAA
jgi:hypothetical protein